MTQVTSAESAVLSASQKGDQRAFARLVERYKNLVCAITFGATGDLPSSEDLAQETFVTAWANLGRLREPQAFRPWLCGIARNLGLRWLRERQRDVLAHSSPIEDAHNARDPKSSPADTAVRREEQLLVQRALAEIPESYRIPLILYYREGRSTNAVAAALELSEPAVRQRLHRGRELLREQVAVLVESSLERTRPGTQFTLGVLAAVRTLPTAPLAASSGATAAHYTPFHWIEAACKHLLHVKGIAAYGAACLASLVLMVGGWVAFSRADAGEAMAVAAESSPSSDSAPAGAPADNAGAPYAVAANESSVVPLATHDAVRPPSPAPKNTTAIVVHSPDAPILEWQDPRTRTQRTGTLAGQLLTLDNEPVANAQVEAFCQYRASVVSAGTARTDDAGCFSMSLPPRGYWLSAWTNDLAGADAYCDLPLVVRPGATCVDQVRMEPALSVQGAVIDEASGNPLAGIVVVTHSGRRARTDMEGRFRLDGVHRRDTVISIVDDDWTARNVVFAGGAGPVRVEIRARRAGVICGKVLGPHGAAMPQVPVILALSGSGFHVGRYTVETNESGFYRIPGVDVSSNRLPVRALANEYRQANGIALAEFKPNARTCTVNIQLTPSPGADYRNETAMFASETADSSEDDAVPAASAPAPVLAGFEGAAGGQVVYPDGSPLPGVLVAAGASRSTTDRQGRFHLSGLTGQRVQVQAAAYSARAPGGVLATLDVGRDDHRIEVRIPEFQVSGRVVDKSTRKPVTQFYVGIGRPSNASRSDMSSENEESFVTSSDGSFLLAGLRAQYGANARLTIRASGYAVATLPQVQLRPAPNDDAEPIVVALAPADANTGFEGVVIDKTTNAPVSDALVVVNEIDALDAKSFPFSVWETTVLSYPRSQRTKTDSNGEFRFPDWCDTKGWVVVERNGYGRQWLRGIAFQSPFRIELDPEAVVSGAVTDSNGKAAPSAGVFIHYYEGDIQIWNQWLHVDESGAFTFRGLSPGRYRVNPTEVTGKKCEDWFTLSAGQTHEVRWH